MTGSIHFRKMNGLGNDFVVLDARAQPLALKAAQIAAIADRNRGIGCDQVIALEPSDFADVFMKRRHSRADAVSFCEEVRRLRPDMVFGADLIAGFPTESEEMFAGSMSLIDDCELTFLHVFPFSARPGTPAARMRTVFFHHRGHRDHRGLILFFSVSSVVKNTAGTNRHPLRG